MGLDAVELVMAFEEAFDLSIPEKDAEHLITVGDVQDYIFRQTRERPNPPSEDEIFERLKIIISNILSVEPGQIQQNSRFVQDLGMD